MSEWIRCSEQTPEKNTMVIVACYNSYRLMMTPMLKSRFVKIKEKHEKEYKDMKSNFDVYRVSYIITHQNAFFEGVWLPEKNEEKAKKMLADIESKNKAIKEGIT